MKKKYAIMLSASIDLTNAEQVINWADQGWCAMETNHTLSLVLIVKKEIEVFTNAIESYVNALNAINNDIRVEWFEEITE